VSATEFGLWCSWNKQIERGKRKRGREEERKRERQRERERNRNGLEKRERDLSRKPNVVSTGWFAPLVTDLFWLAGTRRVPIFFFFPPLKRKEGGPRTSPVKKQHACNNNNSSNNKKLKEKNQIVVTSRESGSAWSYICKRGSQTETENKERTAIEKEMNRFFLVFFCVVQLASASQRAVVNKCCSNRYSILLASCSKPADDGDAGDVETDENEVIATGRSISVHSNQGNQTRDGDFEFTTQLIQCPDGHIVKHDFSFQLRDDGSLVTSWGNFSNGEFCLGQSAEREDPRGLVARFCVKDPCRQTSCLRKCCPLGMAVDLQAKECRPYWKEFDFEIRNEDGTLANSTGVLIVDGVTAPVCEDGINILRPDLYEDSDQFYVLPSGQLKIPAYDSDESITDVYCVDDFFSGNITVWKHSPSTWLSIPLLHQSTLKFDCSIFAIFCLFCDILERYPIKNRPPFQ